MGGVGAPQPIFEHPLPASADNFMQAIERIKSITPFLDEALVLPGISSMLTTQISQPPRALLLVTDSDGLQVDNMLKLVSAHSVTTRSIIVHLQRDGHSNKYVSLLRANGSDVVTVDQSNIESYLPEAVARSIKPSQSLTISWSPVHTHHVPCAPPPLFYNSLYLLFAISSSPVDIKKSTMVNVQLGDEPIAAKLMPSPILHRMACAALLNEICVGVRHDLDQTEQNWLAKVLYSSWSAYESKERPPLVGAVSEPSISLNKRDSNSNLIASMRSISGPLTRLNGSDKSASVGANYLTPSSKRFGPQATGTGGPGGSLSLSDGNLEKKAGMSERDRRLNMMKSTKQMFDLCAADYEERIRIPATEAEAVILEYVVSLVKSGTASGSRLSQGQAQAVRAFVTPLINEHNLARYCVNSDLVENDGVPELDVSKMKQGISRLFAEKWEFNDTATIHKRIYEAHIAAEKGLRPHMEDNYVIIDSASDLFGVEGPSCSFFGVFDGHSGRSAADFCKINLAFNIFRDPSFNAADPSAAITAGYLKTDEDFIIVAKKEKRKAGSTAVTLLVCEDKVFVGNAGDSEAVLCRNGEAVCLSTVHTPANESERRRVETAGGKVISYMGTLRVGGILAVTRSFGDLALKSQVIAEPSILAETIGSGDEFIVLATDGLYEVMKHQEVVDFIRAECAKEPPEGRTKEYSATKNLVAEALHRGSKDNVTALVVFFANK